MSRYVFFTKKNTHTYTNPQPVANPTPSLVPRFSPFRGNLLAVGTGQWPNGWLERMAGSIRIFLKWSYKNSTPQKMAENKWETSLGLFYLVVGAQKLGGALPWSAWDNLTKRVFFQQSWQAWPNSKSSKTECLHCTPQKWVTLVQAIFSHTHRAGLGGLGFFVNVFNIFVSLLVFFCQKLFCAWLLDQEVNFQHLLMSYYFNCKYNFCVEDAVDLVQCLPIKVQGISPWKDDISNGDFIIQRSVFAMFQGG